MYRTLDTYTITLSQPINSHRIEYFYLLLEEHNLMMDFRECFDAISDRKFDFTASCSYRTYKTFFSVCYQAFGAFTAEVSFNEDYSPEDCGYNTTVDFKVDENGNYTFCLLNVLSVRGTLQSSEEYDERRRNRGAPFEKNCLREGNMSDWHRLNQSDLMNPVTM